MLERRPAFGCTEGLPPINFFSLLVRMLQVQDTDLTDGNDTFKLKSPPGAELDLRALHETLPPST